MLFAQYAKFPKFLHFNVKHRKRRDSNPRRENPSVFKTATLDHFATFSFCRTRKITIRVIGLEPIASCSQSKYASQLHYTPFEKLLSLDVAGFEPAKIQSLDLQSSAFDHSATHLVVRILFTRHGNYSQITRNTTFKYVFRVTSRN